MITCTTCLLVKNEEEFYNNRKSKSKMCKTCFKEYNATRYKVRKVKQSKYSDVAGEAELEKLFIKHLLASAKSRAKAIGMAFDLEIEDITIPTVCPVLGFPLSLRDGDKRTTPSLDRLDSSKGYTKDNVVIISWRANSLKSDATVQELTWLAEWYRNEMLKR